MNASKEMQKTEAKRRKRTNCTLSITLLTKLSIENIYQTHIFRKYSRNLFNNTLRSKKMSTCSDNIFSSLPLLSSICLFLSLFSCQFGFLHFLSFLLHFFFVFRQIIPSLSYALRIGFGWRAQCSRSQPNDGRNKCQVVVCVFASLLAIKFYAFIPEE